MDPMTMQMMYNPAAMMQRIGGYQMPQAQNQLANLMQAMQQYRQGSGYQPGSATTGPMPTNMEAMRQAMASPQTQAQQQPMAGNAMYDKLTQFVQKTYPNQSAAQQRDTADYLDPMVRSVVSLLGLGVPGRTLPSFVNVNK